MFTVLSFYCFISPVKFAEYNLVIKLYLPQILVLS